LKLKGSFPSCRSENNLCLEDIVEGGDEASAVRVKKIFLMTEYRGMIQNYLNIRRMG